ncbi:MAG: hypothetical protein LCH92_20620 [Proteobacteria bacterium]|nr:hypothetical protein [Pseudomonadota bacterium]
MATKLKISKMPQVEILNRDMVIDVEVDGDKLGEFRLSKGSVDFYKKGAKTKHHRLSWTELADLMVEKGHER